MKRFAAVLAALMLAMCFTVPAFAASVPVVTYDGGTDLKYTDESGNAISGNGDFGTAFSNMLPGVEYSQQVILNNGSASDSVKFYMSMTVLETLKKNGLDGAGYTVELKSTTETLYSSVNGEITGTLVGGSGSSQELGDINGAVMNSDGTGILVATLAPGAQETLTLTIKADATMSNAYQDAEGVIQFRFFGEKVEPTGVKTVKVPGKTVVKTVKTGDTSPIFIVAGVLVLGVIILLVTGKSKKQQEQEHKGEPG